MKVAIIGGGAAGFFAAINAKENFPQAEVTLFEKSTKLLSKVKISGGGRCNVTNACTSIVELAKCYPRGGKKLKKAFREFSTTDTVAWFERRGVRLYAQDDQRMFPVSDDSQTIVDCLLNACRKLGIEIVTQAPILNIIPQENEQLQLIFGKGKPLLLCDKIIVATGGSPKLSGFEWLEKMGHQIESPLPSLFTFNMPKEPIKSLMGVVAENASVSIQASKLKNEGALLITHWGMSGPAILKLSAFGARELAAMNYHFSVQVNWVNIQQQESVKTQLETLILEQGNKLLTNLRPFDLPKRLWHFLLEKAAFAPTKKGHELGKKGVNKLVTLLSNDVYEVRGKTTFKEEFVTCGGVSLASIDFKTMESRAVKNVYFAGEVLDIDGITGGFNFQAAWTTAFIAAKLGGGGAQ